MTNQELQSRVRTLEDQNRSLLQQLMDLRRSIGQPAAVLMVLAVTFSFAFIGAPSANSTSSSLKAAPEGHRLEQAALDVQASLADWMSWPFSWLSSPFDSVPYENYDRPAGDVVFGARSQSRAPKAKNQEL
jgi:hypothetical protein